VTLNGVVGAARQDGSQLFIADYDTARSAFIYNGVLVSRPTDNPRVLGLQTTDGSRAWLSTLPGATDHEYMRLRLYPVGDRLVYSVAFDQGTPDGVGTEFGALSMADRSQLWRKRIRDESGETIVRGAVADPSGDRVFVARVALNKFDQPTDEAEPTIEAYDLASGQRRWRAETYGLPLAAHDERLFVALPDSNVITGQDLTGMAALRTDSGETLWRREEEPRIYRTAVGNGLAVDDSGLYVAHEQSVLGLDPADGTTQWQYPTSEPVITAPVAAANAVVAGSKRRLHVLSKSDGAQLNTSTVNSSRAQGGITGHVTVAGETIYAGTSQGLRAYSAG
jgi:outer membrane protein assembly factor BamB